MLFSQQNIAIINQGGYYHIKCKIASILCVDMHVCHHKNPITWIQKGIVHYF